MLPITRLLSKNVSPSQILGYALANLVGLTIVLVSIQFYRDVTSGGDSADTFISRDYLIISKKVEGLGSLMGKPVDFSQADIADINAQPWVRRTGAFTAAAFNVYASVDFGGRKMGTALFLEAIPDSFYDVRPEGWNWTPGSPLPIIIAKDYLTLYNFGFAASAGLPQVSESMLQSIPLRLSVSGNGRQEWIDARIVGFSSRLNTIAVPSSFIENANARFAEEPVPAPRRLIIEVSQPGLPAIADYLAAHGYEAAGDKADSSRMVRFLSVITAVVAAVGAVISVLAFFILLLSIYLLLQKNRLKLHRLMELGYTPAAVARPYIRLVGAVNGAVLLASLTIVAGGRSLWASRLTDLGLAESSLLPTIIAGIAITLVVTALNVIAIRRRVNSAFRI